MSHHPSRRLVGVGRALRRHRLTGRLLTEYRVRQMRHTEPEFATCLRYSRPATLAIDVGANVGNYAVGLSKAVGRRGRVLAIEPHPHMFAELRNSTFGAPVRVVHAAASSSSDQVTLHVPRLGRQRQWQLASLEEHAHDEVERIAVRSVRLDELVDDDRPVSLIEIDVEGHEAAVVAGAANTVQQHRPVLVAEIEQRHLPSRTVADVVAEIGAAGYNCFGIRPGSLLPWPDFDVQRDQLDHLDERGELRPEARHR